MGVAGLWDVLRPAGQVRSLSHIAIHDGFILNATHRGFRIGIDASLWFFHAAHGREGENPELRTLFFRCARLLNAPFLPLFVFDGPLRPNVKRGKRIAMEAHWLTTGMKAIIEAFGYEWRTAPGEAEAELAYLNRVHAIDGVLSDDVDNFLFGATLVIRNASATLTGNAVAGPLPTPNHTTVFAARAIEAHADVGLTRGGMILCALLAGGDYHKGLPGCGMKVAVGLARCGFGDKLVAACEDLVSVREDGKVDVEGRAQLEAWLVGWRTDVAQELESNSMGHLPSKRSATAKVLLAFNDAPSEPTTKKKAKEKREEFPDVAVLLLYTRPVTSETYNRSARNREEITWVREPDLGKIAGICETYFEWGWRELIVKRFKTVLWDGAVTRILRRAALELDADAERALLPVDLNPPSTPRKNKNRDAEECGTPARLIARHFASPAKGSRNLSGAGKDVRESLITRIHSERTHACTDGLREYRLEVAPAQLVALVNAGIEGKRQRPEVDDVYAAAREDDEGVSDGVSASESEESEDDDSGDAKKKMKKRPAKKGKARKRTPGMSKEPEFADPSEHVRMWAPACMVRLVEPALVADFEAAMRAKAEKKAGKGKGRARTGRRSAGLETSGSDGENQTPAKKKGVSKSKSKPAARVQVVDDDSMNEETVRANLKVKGGPKAASRPKATDSPSPRKKVALRKIPAYIGADDAMEADMVRLARVDDGYCSPSPRRALAKAKVKPKGKSAAPAYVDVSDADSMDSTAVRRNLVSKPSKASGSKVRAKPPPIPHRPRYASDSEADLGDALPVISESLSPRRAGPRLVAPRPFPVGFDDMDLDASMDPFVVGPSFATAGSSKQTHREPAAMSLGLETAAHEKSPCRSTKQMAPRPASPLPARVRAKQPVNKLPSRKARPVSDLGIIEISSGDEVPAPARKPMKAPLLLAREKKAAAQAQGTLVYKAQKTGGAIARAKPISSMAAGPTVDEDIIDLT